MSIKDLLVHLDDGKANRSRLEMAAQLAQTHGAHLTGLYVPLQFRVPTYTGAYLPANVYQAFDENVAKNTKISRELFSDVVKNFDIDNEWRCQEGNIINQISLNARYTDFVILGQEEDYLAWLDEPVVDKVALSCGRPVLIVPYTGARDTVGERIYVAWDGGRESVRAVNDALPLLKTAQEVKVIAVNAEMSADKHGEMPCADICLHLARHGVNATAYPCVSGDLSVGDTLLSRAADDGIDLIVMGAYGHSRVRELVLGGTTQHIMRHMTVPVLMSH